MRKSNSKLMLAVSLAVTAKLGLPILAEARTPASPAAAAIADAARPAEDTARDAERMPGALMDFAGAKTGAKIAELAPGGGYYTRLLSLAVGPKGHIYAVSGRPVPALDGWVKDHPQVSVSVIKAGEALAPEPVDIVWTTENYHDFKNAKVGESDAAALYNEAAFKALKPGGVYLINDHAAAVGAPADVTSTLHRIEAATVIREVEAAGFKYAGKSDALAHPADDHTMKVFDPAIRGKTDQFVLKFVKPKG